MNTFQFMLVLLGQGVFMALLTFAVVYGIASILGIGENIVDVRITFTFFVVSCIALYGSSFGVFAGVQKDSCNEVKSWKQIAINAGIPTLIHAAITLLVIFVPWFQSIVGNLLPPDTPAFGKTAAAFAYYTFWSTLMGGALGGTLSGSCKVEDVSVLPKSLQLPEVPELPTELPESRVQFNLPPSE